MQLNSSNHYLLWLTYRGGRMYWKLICHCIYLSLRGTCNTNIESHHYKTLFQLVVKQGNQIHSFLALISLRTNSGRLLFWLYRILFIEYRLEVQLDENLCYNSNYRIL